MMDGDVSDSDKDEDNDINKADIESNFSTTDNDNSRGDVVANSPDLNQAEAASNVADEEMELLLLKAAEHMNMERPREHSIGKRLPRQLQMQRQGGLTVNGSIPSLWPMGRTWYCPSTTKSSPE